MELLILLSLFILGLAVGSFLNVLIYKLEGKKRKNLRGRSFCPECGEAISWYDNVPVVSWLLLGGKCRKCQKKISIQYPLVELFTSLVFVLLGYTFLFPLLTHTPVILSEAKNLIPIINLIFWLFFSSTLIVIFAYDLKHKVIPNEAIYTGYLAALFFIVFNAFGAKSQGVAYLVDHVAAGASAFVIFMLIAIVGGKIFKQSAMGGGDIKLVLFIGLILGLSGTSVALYFAFTLGAVVGVLTLLTRKKKMNSQIPFGPFLVLGCLASLFFGEKIISFYARIFM